MLTVLRAQLRRWAVRATYVVIAVVVVGSAALSWLWRDRPSLEAVDWQPYPRLDSSSDAVTVTWLGVSTLLFDDGQTQILIDGFFSHPSLSDLVFGRPIQSDAATIDYVLDEYQMRRLAVIIPGHSHFDHAMDAGAIANRTSASILGTETTANYARGAGVPEDQLLLIEDGEAYSFGQFTVTLIGTPHAPFGWGGSVPYDGEVESPLVQPAPASAWKASQNHLIVIAHPYGTAVVQGTAGFSAGALDSIQADVVMLGVQLLETLGERYAEQYWQELVTTTGARQVIPIHFDDFTQPFGETRLLPRFIEDIANVANWLEKFRDRWDKDTRLHWPVFGQQLVLYSGPPPEA